jgi:hypothetical protein
MRRRRNTSLGETTRRNNPWYHPLLSARAGYFGSWVRMRASRRQPALQAGAGLTRCKQMDHAAVLAGPLNQRSRLHPRHIDVGALRTTVSTRSWYPEAVMLMIGLIVILALNALCCGPTWRRSIAR